nr:RHS repeat-associated core domain-containing protein [Prevotella fusca]
MVWQADYDIYGNVRNLHGSRKFIPFRQLGQYEDDETGLYYNRFRYYDARIGNYINQDPIRLGGGNPTLYGYVIDTNVWIDEFGLYSDLLGTGMGHHLIPRSVAKKLDLTNFLKQTLLRGILILLREPQHYIKNCMQNLSKKEFHSMVLNSQEQ